VPLRNTSTLLGACTLASLIATSVHAQNPSHALDTVQVTVASRTVDAAREARSTTVITRDDIARTAARSLTDVLALAMGADVRPRSLASADIALRGASSEGVVVLVNGVRVSDQQTGHFALDLAVPLDAVERVEILRGTSSALHGANAVGGVVNIVTRVPAGASLAASGGSFGTASLGASAATRAAGTSLFGSVDAARSDGHRPGTDYRVTQARGGVQHPLAGGTLRLDGGVAARRFGAAGFYGAYPSFEDTHTTTASARWDGALPAGWSLSTGIDTRRHGDLFTLYRDQPARYQNHHVTWQSGASALARREVSDVLAVAIGADASDLQLRSARLGDRAMRRDALFSQVTLGRADGPVLDGGLRVDHSSVDGTFASPSVAASLPINDIVRVRLSGARGYRAPTWTERYYRDPANIGSPSLSVERFWTGEAGVRATPTTSAFIDVAAFVRDARGLIDWARPLGAPDSVPWHTMNVARARYRGIEGEGGARDPLGGIWRVRVSGLAFDAGSAAGYRGKYALSPITRSVGASATYPVGILRIAVDATDERRAAEAAHTVVNARATLPVRGATETRITLDALNLGNAQYLDVSGMPVAGRAVYLGVRWAAR
jgi:iron complex outermembrane receptor protein